LFQKCHREPWLLRDYRPEILFVVLGVPVFEEPGLVVCAELVIARGTVAKLTAQTPTQTFLAKPNVRIVKPRC
jgi:hypothetical protein